MRRAVGAVLLGLGWVLLVYFGILAVVLLLGSRGRPWVGVLTAAALVAGAAMVMGGNLLRRRGLIWRVHRDRLARERDRVEGPFGRPRGE